MKCDYSNCVDCVAAGKDNGCDFGISLFKIQDGETECNKMTIREDKNKKDHEDEKTSKEFIALAFGYVAVIVLIIIGIAFGASGCASIPIEF